MGYWVVETYLSTGFSIGAFLVYILFDLVGVFSISGTADDEVSASKLAGPVEVGEGPGIILMKCKSCNLEDSELGIKGLNTHSIAYAAGRSIECG